MPVKPASLRRRKRRAEQRAQSGPPKRARTAAERMRSFRRGGRSPTPSSSGRVRVSNDGTPNDDVLHGTGTAVSLGVIPNLGQTGNTDHEQHAHPIRCSSYTNSWRKATTYFQRRFEGNQFGYSCDVCDRLWFRNDLKTVNGSIADFLQPHFPEEDTSRFNLCSNCRKVCSSKRIPNMSKSNGYKYPPKPINLPDLDPLTERLISPRIPFMQIRRLRYSVSYGIVGQVINVPVDVDTMVKCLPRSLDDDYAFNVNLKKHIIHKSTYMRGYVKKSVVKAWLRYLIQQPLYKYYNIACDVDEIDSYVGPDEATRDIESLDPGKTSASELIDARQQTMLWNEDDNLDIAPGQNRRPESLLYDKYAEELSFPAIYLGCAREIKSTDGSRIRSTPYLMCMSEIRRSDRRGVTPQHILYMAMKILRFRVRDGIQNMFRCLRTTQNITREMIEDRDFVSRLIDINHVFLRSIPNSVQYWNSRKKDLFAMIRQLGKPTAFMTLSANEINWPGLLRILFRLSDKYRQLGDDINEDEIFSKLDLDKRADLVCEDPVTCAIYFHKLVTVIMSMLTTKSLHNPFGRHRVVDYFLRIEWQNRGSPHAHILLWLDNDPSENISESMPRTVQLLTDLCSVDKNDLSNPEMIRNHIHAHTFTCTKRGEKQCRFGIPYWPAYYTMVLLPFDKEDHRQIILKQKVKDARNKLETMSYASIALFLEDIQCDYEDYLNLIRSSLRRPTIIFKRDMTQIFINTFNPWIASTFNSNMDLQVILDPFSCATYVVDYVNKSERGMSHLHRELLRIHEANPEYDQTQLMSKVGLRILNSVEMPAQEAAWYLLRQPMSWASRITVSIPTMALHERYKARKRKSVMDAQNLERTSTDIWTKSIIEKYEERPGMEDVTLAQFVAWYAPQKSRPPEDEESFDDVENDADQNDIPDGCQAYYKRKVCRIIRYRNYKKSDLLNHQREMVTLHMPFRNELRDILDRNKFVDIYEANEHVIMERRQEFEANIDIVHLMQEIELMRSMSEEDVVEELPESNISTQMGDDGIDYDMQEYLSVPISAVKPRNNVLSKADYCALIRGTNPEQRELILEVIHRLHSPVRKPIQIFLTGPAGCGKTYLLKALMETYNRYTQAHNSMNNAYIATATTGKAAVELNGVTVHSAFRLTISRQTHHLSPQILQSYRHHLRNINCVIIDEISMCGSNVFESINARLQAMTGIFDMNFGGLDLIACGDLKQLPPVLASPVFCATRNSIGGALLWQSLDYYPLNRIMRQSDAVFSTLLTKLGRGRSLTDEERNLIQSRFRSREWCQSNLSSGVTRLFFNNVDVERFNEETIPLNESTERLIAGDTYTGYSNDREKRDAVGKVHKMDARKTGNLPYCLTLTIGFPYMVTVNVDVEDGIVNGAIGKLRYVECYPTRREEIQSKRVWLEFDSKYIGCRARLKYRAHVRSKRNVLSEHWVPIELRSTNIHVTANIKCKRSQFPLLPACALTIHKSQGGTFDEIVYNYHKDHSQQLVYVALSRVTSLDGLYLTNSSDDFEFYHAQGSASPTTRSIENEYERLSSHRLPTLTTGITKFVDETTSNNMSLIIVNLNAQSLSAHGEDISSDSLLSRADLLVTTETWIHSTAEMIEIDGFLLHHNQPCEKRSGGVAVYRRRHMDPLSIIECEDRSCVSEIHHGDVSISKIALEGKLECMLIAMYIHQHVSHREMKNFILQAIGSFQKSSNSRDRDIPMVLLGDFNVVDQNRLKLERFLTKHFGLRLDNNIEEGTTLGGTCIDLTFSRGLDLECKPYVSYFSYHRPVFNKISLAHRV